MAAAWGKPVMRRPFSPRPEDVPYLRRLAWTIVMAAVLLIVWRAADLLTIFLGTVPGAAVG